LTFGDESMAVFSVVKLSELEGAKRIDAEYYKPEYVITEKKIKRYTHDKLNNIISILTDYHANGSYESLRSNVELLDKPDYALILRTLNFVRDDFKHDVKYISKHAYDFLAKTKLFGYEIVINKIGEPGEVYMVPPLPNKMSLGMNLFMIKPKEEINGNYLYVYLISSFGRAALKRRVTGSVPLSIDKDGVRNVFVPILNKEFQLQINNLIESHFKFQFNSYDFYSQAENLLLEELGLKDFKPKYEKTYTANLSDTLSTHRIDAEYFQPAYDEAIEKINERAKVEKLKNITSFINHGKQPYYVKDGDVLVLTQKHLGPQLLTSHSEILNMPDTPRTDREFIKNYPEYLIKPFDVLFYSVGAYLGRANVVLENFEAVPASFITVIRTKQEVCNPVYLALFLNSEIGQLQSSRWKSASDQQYIYPKEIKEFIIPILPFKTQQKIASLIQKSYEARKKAKELLNATKKAVEIAFEKSEKDALNYLSSFSDNY